MAKHKPNPRSRIAENLATAMAACPVLSSQAALARRSGVGQTTIGRILRGESDPGTEVVRKLARALQVPLATLLTESAQAGDFWPLANAPIRVCPQTLRDWALDSSPANMAALNEAIQIATEQRPNNSFKPKPLLDSA